MASKRQLLKDIDNLVYITKNYEFSSLSYLILIFLKSHG